MNDFAYLYPGIFALIIIMLFIIIDYKLIKFYNLVMENLKAISIGQILI